MTSDEYWYWICNIEGIGNAKIKRLLDIFYTPENIFNASRKQLENLGFCIDDIDRICSKEIREQNIKEYATLEKKGVNFICRNNQHFPEKLINIDNPPYCIYIIGTIKDITNPSIAIIGARNCTEYGRAVAKNFAFELSSYGINIISGMARGIDCASQWGAVNAGGTTYGVLGCGVDVCYPRDNIELYEMISRKGALISEYPIGSQPLAWRFPLRNRIISGLADCLLVIEAREKSGSLITVEYALQQGKDVFAIPGRIEDNLSQGCNRLIREGAGIVTSPKDILEEMNVNLRKNVNNQEKNNLILEKELESLYSNLSYFPKSLENIINETGKSPQCVMKSLVKLQLMNLIDETAKNYYSKKI